MIGGFIISATSPKTWSSERSASSWPTSACPASWPIHVLELYDSTGADRTKRQLDIAPSRPSPSMQPSNPAESVIAMTLPAGSYTAVLRAATTVPATRCARSMISRRATPMSPQHIHPGMVGTGDDVMIGGPILGGQNPQRFLSARWDLP